MIFEIFGENIKLMYNVHIFCVDKIVNIITAMLLYNENNTVLYKYIQSVLTALVALLWQFWTNLSKIADNILYSSGTAAFWGSAAGSGAKYWNKVENTQ